MNSFAHQKKEKEYHAPYDSRRAALEVVAHEGLLLVAGAKVLVISAQVIAGAGLLALGFARYEGLDVDRVLPVIYQSAENGYRVAKIYTLSDCTSHLPQTNINLMNSS